MIYLDNSATTPLCQKAKERMESVMNDTFANPSSRHAPGLEARKLVTEARRAVLSLLGLPFLTPETAPYNLFFTSGGTEANNLAILGVAYAKERRNGRPRRIILSEGEHPSVAVPVEKLEAEGFDVRHIPTRGGALDMAALQAALTPETVLVSLMAVNNETGARYDIASAFALVKRLCPGAVTHTDAVQAFGKLPLSPKALQADMMSISAHKLGGPKGVGALVVAKEVLVAKKLSPVLFGGGQEGGLRSGTENTVGIAGFFGAVEEAKDKLNGFAAKADERRQYLIGRLPCGVQVNQPVKGAPHILSLTVPGIKSETLLHYLSAEGICVSAGSACSSNAKHASISRALVAFGLSEQEADSTVRLSFNGSESDEALDRVAEVIGVGAASLIRK